MMPTICRFDGMVIRMYFAEHGEPHFHAFKAEHSAKYFWRRDEWIGALPKADEHKVKSWAGNRQEELEEVWNALRSGRSTIPKVAPPGIMAS
ncbi:MAG: DUF4160 domain-containing protein [Caldilineaceae bacterium SB0662_bin_9]|uniref:DUF4160 domain-containing protein n=1 Tax=Caldilineaceae bacterium SB0662_bin_9 TaxID=2605258 RepID=A0A6B1DW94_9CHLR|nr:DUF4160 domain-containing protein [Caldilineaceae bacterium SB0662_bin_9]